MKISEFRNEQALETIADLIEPLGEILGDQTFRAMIENGKANKMQIAAYALKRHAGAIIEILARMDGVPKAEYNKSVIGMTKDLLAILNDEELKGFFPSQGQMTASASSGSATEITGETETT